MKRKILSVAAACFVLLFSLPQLYSQDDNASSNFSIGADAVSRYVWRGLNLGGASPHIQPYMEYSFGESGLAIGAWGSYSLGLGLAGTEADLYLSYSPIDWLNVTLTDYFFPADEAFERNDYFNYNTDETAHTLEAMLTVGGSDNIPVYATFAINIFGADGLNSAGEAYNAKYLEVGYNGSMNAFDYSTFAGFALDDPETDLGGSGWYGDSAGIINLGVSLSKEYTLAQKSIPVMSSLIFNPEAGNIYLVFGISF